VIFTLQDQTILSLMFRFQMQALYKLLN